MVVSLKPDTIRSGFRDWFVGEENSDGEQRCYCPICEDPAKSSSPSAMMNPNSDLWNCLKGNHGGSITVLAKQLKAERGWDIRAQSMTGNSRRVTPTKKASTTKGPPPSPQSVTAWHEALLDNPRALRQFIGKRGIDEESIAEYELGWDARTSRYTIPVYDRDGELVNIRKYKLNSGQDEQKFINHAGHGSARLFMPWILEEKEGGVILAEGELDCLLLSQMGFPAVSGTGGSKTWLAAWSAEFTGKTVYIAYDQDDAGEQGAARVTNALANFAVAVYRVKLPTPGSDVTDFFMEEGFDVEDFESLLKAASAAGNRASTVLEDMPTSGTRFSLQESLSDAPTDGPIELIVSVTGKQMEPYTAPKRVVATCGMDKGVACETCPLQTRNGNMEVITQAHDTRLVHFVDVSSSTQHKLLRALTGARCADRVRFDIEELWRVEELQIQNSIDERTEETENPVRRTVLSVGTFKSQPNEKIRLIGENVQDPKTGALRFMSWINQKVELDIDKFRLDGESRQRLEQFRPDDSQTYLEKCIDIAQDMSANVTGIIGRDLLHVGMDLVWHSPVSFTVHGKPVDKGWLEMMVVGDTRTGKSEIAGRLMDHYNSGRMVSCEGVTFAGLIGGVQQINNRWTMTWGVVPMMDRRLVVLDEVSGMAERNIIEQMSQVRSSGVAQITKIAQESTSARVRLIWISNPVGGKFLGENRLGGIGALLTVVPNMEDIARFDFVMAAAKGDVSSTDINADNRGGTPHYSSDDCELLVKWAWSLGRDQIQIGTRAVEAASLHAIKMGERYTASPPLVQAENVRFKILRIAAAMAARTFSMGKSGKLLVGKAHVDDAVTFLDAIYAQDSLGYGRISTEEIERTANSEDHMGLARQLLQQHPEVFETLFMNVGGAFRVRDFEEFQGMERTTASSVTSALHKWGLTKYDGKGVFTMTEQLIELLEWLKKDGM